MMDFNGPVFHSDALESCIFGPADHVSSSQGQSRASYPAPSVSKQGLNPWIGSGQRRTEIPLLTASAPGEFDYPGAS